ncbi:hypothetical protein SDC9_49915 [bioreactor metagenome]|uniref:Outer membrane protein beta-barrel domain-containing protein n=1 Tax=bioreactor metagenome TaxID=1076179 RepID=A0A644WJI0_9ZZZZ
MSKYIIAIIAVFALIAQAEAQETSSPKTKEYCFSLPLPADLSALSFGFDYKMQFKNSTFLKLSALSLSYTNQENTPTSTSDFSTAYMAYSGGLGVGLEFRKNLSDKFTFYHGPGIGVSYQYSENTNNDPAVSLDFRQYSNQTMIYNVNYSLGFMYSVCEHFLVSAQLSASFNYRDGKNEYSMNPSSNNTSKSFYGGFSDEIGSISLIYRR